MRNGAGGVGGWCYLAKQVLRTEKVWSFISQQIQIRILIPPLNLVYPFNPRLGDVYMYVSEKQRDREAADSAPEQAKNTALYVFLFIKHDEWSHYINTMGADSGGKVCKTGRDGEEEWSQSQ